MVIILEKATINYKRDRGKSRTINPVNIMKPCNIKTQLRLNDVFEHNVEILMVDAIVFIVRWIDTNTILILGGSFVD